MKVIISNYVETQLEDICNYYIEEGYKNYGNELQENIVKSIHRLSSFPNLGKIDEDNLGQYSYRYLIEGVHRIYYRIDPNKEAILLFIFLIVAKILINLKINFQSKTFLMANTLSARFVVSSYIK